MKKSFILAISAVLALAGCSKKAELAGAGATFPEPYYNMSFQNFSQETGIPVSYGGIGSGGGIRSLGDKTVDFAGTDNIPSADDLAGMDDIVLIPSCRGAIVLSYNLKGITELNLTASAATRIFLGQITRWNDPELAALNPGAELPDLAITPVYRSDGSGTTFNFSTYMSSVDTLWAARLGAGKTVDFPVGVASKGNPGVAGTIANTEGAIGYIGGEYAFATGMATARLDNGRGAFTAPTNENIAADRYPIVCTTYLALYKEQSYNDRTRAQAEATVNLMLYMLRDDVQARTTEVYYAPLSAEARAQAMETLRSVTFGGEPLIKQ